MQQSISYNVKWLPVVSLLVFFACIGSFVLTDSYFFLAIPFVFLFVLLMGMNWKTAYWILLFCIPPSIELNFSQDTMAICLPDEPMMWMFLVLFVTLWAKQPDLIPRWWWKNPLVLVIGLQFLWLIVAVIFSHVLLFSVKFTIAKVWYLVCFLVLPLWVFKEKKDFKKAFMLMLIPMLVTMFIITAREAMLHFNFRKVEKAIGGMYYNHVEYSTVLSMFFPLLCVAFPLTKKMNILARLALFFTILFFLFVIYFTYARAAYIALVFALVVGIAVRLKLVNFIMPVIYAAMISLVVYLAHDNRYFEFRPDYRNTYMHKTFKGHIVATLRGEDMSSMERLYRWIAAIRMSYDSPLVGYGPHAFYYYYKPYAVSAFRTYVSRNLEHSTTHNYFLYMLVEQGIPAMVLYGILIAMFFAQAQKVYHRFKDKFYKACTMGLATLFAAGFINNFFSELIETHKVGALFYLAIALLIILDKKSKEERDQTAIEAAGGASIQAS